MSNHWLAIASAEHVRRGRAQGFMQVCHGKRGPLRRILPGSGIIYYSPTEIFGARDGLRAFTAIGTVKDRDPYQFDMRGGFAPFRRDVDWMGSRDAPITPLLDRLDFTAGNRNWGYQLRFGVLAISAHAFELIAEAMGVVARSGIQ